MPAQIAWFHKTHERILASKSEIRPAFLHCPNDGVLGFPGRAYNSKFVGIGGETAWIRGEFGSV
jgi:hypothetical protein